ncbi:hypothetical protein HPP92_013768 [Vanilla planifolia]|uniref:X8 domain-containing protein n=1 Tax=Vanilla planifolia TaxID=51239 RepID=A0A835PE58_VANPL|nr:hypothetical protein HPP92_026490 [Vanilla planifolia]KAG0479049.1 hypothetical protein HPP92_013768 [Vanilla planifolia]
MSTIRRPKGSTTKHSFISMVKVALILSLLSTTLLLPFSLAHAGNAKLIKNNQRTWCVAKPSSDDSTLLNILHYACSMTGCRPLEKDGPCFLPNSLISHASVAMNLYYQAMGRNRWNCHFNNTGLIVITDPSYGTCRYV